MQNTNPEVRRDRLSIILRILETACTPIKKTHILYQAGINYYQLSRYLNLLVREGMIEQISEPYLSYRTTEKGHVLLKLFSSKEIGMIHKGIMSDRKPESNVSSNSLLSEFALKGF